MHTHTDMRHQNVRCIECTGWQNPIYALSCRSFFANKPLITGLFCGKWPIKIRHQCVSSDTCTYRNASYTSAMFAVVDILCRRIQPSRHLSTGSARASKTRERQTRRNDWVKRLSEPHWKRAHALSLSRVVPLVVPLARVSPTRETTVSPTRPRQAQHIVSPTRRTTDNVSHTRGFRV